MGRRGPGWGQAAAAPVAQPCRLPAPSRGKRLQAQPCPAAETRAELFTEGWSTEPLTLLPICHTATQCHRADPANTSGDWVETSTARLSVEMTKKFQSLVSV